MRNREKLKEKIIPEEAIMEMKRNFTLPEIGPSFNDVWYLEETMPIARELVELYRSEGETFKRNANKRPLVENQDSASSDKKPRMEVKQPSSVNRGLPRGSPTRHMEIDAAAGNKPTEGRVILRPEDKFKRDDRKDIRNRSGSRDRRDRDKHEDRKDERRGPPSRDNRRDSRDRGRDNFRDPPRKDSGRASSRERRERNQERDSGSFRDDRRSGRDDNRIFLRDERDRDNRRGLSTEAEGRPFIQDDFGIRDARGPPLRNDNQGFTQRDEMRHAPPRDDNRSFHRDETRDLPSRDDSRVPSPTR